ncbi:hypothetical protein NM688_g5696 [Phlebia brevispora]|uniref:Uncharacterized protein n=1 Tax=Phlebia brevispora TaxID=194682 RepID=A0ACC1SRC1_9APHY|nr:hypothetical protein NM688_g5696 [Phlebia brevispora]
MLINLLPAALQYLLTSRLFAQPSSKVSDPHSLKFELRHGLGISNSTSRVVFSDISSSSQFAPEPYVVDTTTLTIPRARSQSRFFSARMRGAQHTVDWDDTDVVGPNVRDRETLQMLAKMTNNAYSQPGSKDWYDLGPEWNSSYPFGWEPDADGFRGHIFATEDNSTVIVSIKGTSAGWIVGGGGPTTRKDKLNDNLLFSCCCARVGPTWTTVCPCYKGKSRCDQNCLEDSLAEESLFYTIGINLYNNVTYMYPHSNIWLVGHSLGGSLASLVGLTFGAPVVAFESPGEKLAASRLHLPLPVAKDHIVHVYHTADPIAMGTCNGVSSSCAIAGYAMETRCHLGKVIRYDTVSKLHWSVDVRTHGIAVIVNKLLSDDWEEGDVPEGNKTKGGVPPLTEEEDCSDCFNWEFGEFKDKSLGAQSCGN